MQNCFTKKLHRTQHGFLSGLRIEPPILKKKINNKLGTLPHVIFFDLKSAFLSVKWLILFNRMRSMRINGIYINTIKQLYQCSYNNSIGEDIIKCTYALIILLY